MKRLMETKHLSGMRHLLWIAVLPALVTGCVKKSNDNNATAASQLMKESIDLACTYRDSVKLAKDSATVLRLMQDFDDRMTKLNYKYPADVFLYTNESHDEALTNVTLRIVELRDSVLLSLSPYHKVKNAGVGVETDSITGKEPD